MRYGWLIGLVLLLCTAAPTAAQISIGIGVPSLDIGIHFPALPSLTIVPGSPVYYAPRVNSNFFFYDGMYWVYQDDNWYASSWYNGPWAAGRPQHCAGVHLARPGQLLPPSSDLFPRMGGERSAEMGRALG